MIKKKSVEHCFGCKEFGLEISAFIFILILIFVLEHHLVIFQKRDDLFLALNQLADDFYVYVLPIWRSLE